jgi:hypothetical protein
VLQQVRVKYLIISHARIHSLGIRAVATSPVQRTFGQTGRNTGRVRLAGVVAENSSRQFGGLVYSRRDRFQAGKRKKSLVSLLV